MSQKELWKAAGLCPCCGQPKQCGKDNDVRRRLKMKLENKKKQEKENHSQQTTNRNLLKNLDEVYSWIQETTSRNRKPSTKRKEKKKKRKEKKILLVNEEVLAFAKFLEGNQSRTMRLDPSIKLLIQNSFLN